MAEDNSLTVAIENVISALFEDVHTCMPGRIESYVFGEAKATIKPLLKKVFNDGTILELPVLPNVPIVFQRTNNSGLTFPMKVGDGVLLLFSERALERWYLSGQDSEPGDPRRYDLSDAIATPGLFGFNTKNLASNNEDLEIHHNGFKITITAAGKISLVGASGLDLVKIIDDWMTQMQNSLVITGIGLQPFDPTSLAAMAVIQAKLQELLA